jgi:hypothetical protein
VQLALSAGELANDHADFAESASDGSDEEDVREVESLVGNGRPALGVEIPGMQGSASRKRAPPPTPLVLSPAPAVPAPVVPPAPGSDSEDGDAEGGLPYLEEQQLHDDERERDLLSVPRKSMYDPGKRRGDVYDDMGLDLGRGR